MDSAGIDYHVMLAGNVFQQCLDNPGLQEELLCALCKQTSRIMTQSSKHGVQVKNKPSRLHTRVSFFSYIFYLFFIYFLKIFLFHQQSSQISQRARKFEKFQAKKTREIK